MVKETHSYGSLIFTLIAMPWLQFFFFSNYSAMYQIILICVIIYFADFGSLLPDLDLKSSCINKRHPWLFKKIGKKCRHRGETHSLLALFIISIILFIIVGSTEYNIAFVCACVGVFIGYASHLFLDLFTKEGIELFYPCKANIFLLRIKTNSKTEKNLSKLLYYLSVIGVFCDIYLLFL